MLACRDSTSGGLTPDRRPPMMKFTPNRPGIIQFDEQPSVPSGGMITGDSARPGQIAIGVEVARRGTLQGREGSMC